MNSRRGLIGAAAALGVVGGLGVGLWRSGLFLREPAGPDLWALRFDQPGGGELVLAEFRGRPLLLNFWATWCPPCVTEMPLLDEFHRSQQPLGWQVVGLAVDRAEPVREFLLRRPMTFRIGIADSQGVALSRAMGNPSGGLPFSVVFDARGKVVGRKVGAIESADLGRWRSDAENEDSAKKRQSG